SPLAVFASVQRVLSCLPGLEKLAWTAILPEYDPYKYNSFPIQAGEQIHALTTQLARATDRLEARERLADFPPTLVFQSVVDATISPAAVVDRLLSKVPPNGSALVLFDVNRIAQAEPFMRTAHEAFLRLLLEADALPFELTLVTNAARHTGVVVARTRRAGPGVGPLWMERELDLVWPDGVYSLSHVAIPFPPDDPVYGARDRARGTSPLNLGALDLRGERGVFGVSMDQIMRLRYNPFFPYLRARLEAMIDAF
ncbi:MAG: alpha/beta hydrolase, partial [Gemmatimonadota bacterium]